ncbi:phosphate ABC transporter ATP-binding protein PstB [Jeotgalicoccus meleagridis]|jgi:phosphate transport system ATP-binding protein|uniref:Phosphate import ATP-binding protein PstB 3 n=1 Tax=Jeotgalicoccus meleagridis TaxID=2759181 RepID=A0A6V7RL76_9STAP|nr:phosphate ABC transporter ATP-binding protein PstB [Jeotgalicoccus meleagridis]CAD2078112.1 Phosphate import ATP-binding protein PstB 3 [Jeotgalicoccus meleagridis]HIW37395.1 phosphate ABC transporter ATP-binding protein [Candidatus Jeotgalicoccus stercoravium]
MTELKNINVKENTVGSQVTTKDSPIIQTNKEVVFEAKNFNLWYGDNHALQDINLTFHENDINAIIGPSGCGKSTFVKSMNRMTELVPIVRTEGSIDFRGDDIFTSGMSVEELRTRVGMVFQKPNPFPKSIYDNVAYGPRVHGIKKKSILDEVVEKSLRGASIWDEVKDRLNDNAYGLSGGQQQRICIARTLAVEPEVILMDEPTSALDPISTTKIEDLMQEIKKDYSIIIVTHNMQQAARVSDRTSFFYQGYVVESDDTKVIFENPSDKRTEDYVSGRFG